LFSAEPGALISPAFAEEFAAALENCELVKLGPGAHYLQEDHPKAIGKAIAARIAENRKEAASERRKSVDKTRQG
jgi:haloalkane dehalogenase